jgi:hypothetical protein
MSFVQTLKDFSNITLQTLSNPTQQAVKRQNILIHQFEDENDPEKLAIIYQLYLNTGGDLRYLEMNSRPPELIKQMGKIYRQNINYTGYDSV